MRRRSSLLSLLAGLVVMAMARLATPLGSPPLYDGVVVQDPYRYLTPGPGQAGSPTSQHSSLQVSGATSPEFVAATTESPPQAQLVAQAGAFVLPPGITSMTVTIDPVTASPTPPGAQVAGNAYRISVADQSGAELSVGEPAMATVILRAPDGASSGSISRLVGTAWEQLTTVEGGQPGIFLTNVTELGEFAVTEEQGLGGVGSIVLVAGTVTTLLSATVLGAVVLWRRSRQAGEHDTQPARRGRPSKRRRGGRRRRGQR